MRFRKDISFSENKSLVQAKIESLICFEDRCTNEYELKGKRRSDDTYRLVKIPKLLGSNLPIGNDYVVVRLKIRENELKIDCHLNALHYLVAIIMIVVFFFTFRNSELKSLAYFSPLMIATIDTFRVFTTGYRVTKLLRKNL
jgi:hypothetical protein